MTKVEDFIYHYDDNQREIMLYFHKLLTADLGLIEKTRFEVSMGDHVFEVDEFLGDNQGLTVAEVELKSEKESFQKPAWLGKEVTGDIKYYNSNLSNNPFSNWQ